MQRGVLVARTLLVPGTQATQLADQTGNDEMTTRLKKVVEIDDADTGTVRLKKGASKIDEMSLDTASTKTSRVRR